MGRSAAYPAQLQRVLDDAAGPGVFQVRGFGKSGAMAAAAERKKHYADTTQCDAAVAFQAHAYVMMLGTNDAWHRGGMPMRAAEAVGALALRFRFDARRRALRRRPRRRRRWPPR